MRVLSLLLLPAFLAVGCGGGSTKKPVTTTDMAMSIKGDMTASDGCTQIATWPMSKVFAFSDTTQKGYQYVDGVGDDEPNATTSTNNDELLYRYYYQAGSPKPVVPHPYDISVNDQFQTCIDCVTAFINSNPDLTNTDMSANNGDFYFAQAGTLNVMKLDNGTETGTVAVSGTGIQLVLWDYANDIPDTSGKCIDVGSFDFTATYDNTPADGGVDGGST